MKKFPLVLLKAAIAAVMLILLVKTVSLQTIIAAFQRPDDIIYMYAAFILFVPNLLLQWQRWHYLLRLNRSAAAPLDSLGSLLGGMMLGFSTPGRVGEAGRAFFLPDGDRLEIIGLVVIDKLYSFIWIIIGGIWGMVLLFSRKFLYELFIVLPLIFLAAAVSFLLVLAALRPDILRTIFYTISLILPYRDKLKKFMHCLDLFGRKEALFLFAQSAALYAVFIIQFALLARAFQPLSAEAAFSAPAAAILTKTLLPVSLADLGVREGASVYFFLQYGVNKAAGFNSALLLFAVNVLFPSVLGLVMLPKLGIGRRSAAAVRSGDR